MPNLLLPGWVIPTIIVAVVVLLIIIVIAVCAGTYNTLCQNAEIPAKRHGRPSTSTSKSATT